MPIARAHLNRFVQDQQEIAAVDSHMSGRVILDLVAGGKAYKNLVSTVKQSPGAAITDPIEVSPPVGEGYDGTASNPLFRELIEYYYRMNIAMLMRMAPGMKINAKGNVFAPPPVVALFHYTEDQPQGAW